MVSPNETANAIVAVATTAMISLLLSEERRSKALSPGVPYPYWATGTPPICISTVRAFASLT